MLTRAGHQNLALQNTEDRSLLYVEFFRGILERSGFGVFGSRLFLEKI